MITAAAFLLAFLGGLALCVWRHPVFGLYTYVAVFYLNPPSRWWSVNLPDLRWAFIAAGLTLLVTLAKGYGDSQPRWMSFGIARLFVCYVLLMWIQTLWAVDLSTHVEGLILFTKYVVVLYLIYALIDTLERAAMFLIFHAGGCLYLGILAYFATYADRLDGVGGPGIDDASSLGMQLAAGAFSGAAVFLTAKGPLKWIGALSIPFALNGVILAASRGGFLGLVCGGLAFYLFGPARRRGMLIAFAIAGIALFIHLAPPAFWERMGTISSGLSSQPAERDGSVEARLALIPAQWKMVLDHPFGAGYDGTASLSEKYIARQYQSSQGGRSSHNTIMSALVDQGFVGLIMWVWLLVLVFARVRYLARWAKVHKDDRLGWIAASIGATLATVVISGLFAPFIAKEIYVWCLALVCCLLRIVRLQRTNLTFANESARRVLFAGTAISSRSPEN